jgi:hypothetical protein
MPSLIGTGIASNYRKAFPSTKFSTRELVHALITVDTLDLTDESTSDGNFAKAIQAIQTLGEVYAVGAPTFGEGASNFTVIIAADTVGDSNHTDIINSNQMDSDNSMATNLETVLNELFGQPINVTFTTMLGLAYD